MSVAVRNAGSHDAPAVSELLPGEDFALLDVSGGWAWGYCVHDHYVGYVIEDALVAPGPAPTHVVTAPIALAFVRPDIKTPILHRFPFGSRLAGRPEREFLTLAEGGFVHLRHVDVPEAGFATPLEAAHTLLGAPYLWGGRTATGIDCSGLVQQAFAMTGTITSRDSDQQRAALGRALAPNEALVAGDLVFFPGHVGLMADADQLLHANAHWMSVTIEPLADVVDRLRATCPDPILARRRVEP